MADRSGFAEFVAACSPRLLRTAYLLTHDRGQAEDLLQTALTKTWLAWPRIVGDPEPYVRRVLATTYVSWWRLRSHHEKPTADVLDGPALSAAPSDERVDLWAALGRLPRRQRAVVVLRFWEDLPEAAVAAALGCSVGTVKSQASKALAKLRIDPRLAGNDVPTAPALNGGEAR
jgi:RNA polymerase sigma-70 factor (sigma-E family)